MNEQGYYVGQVERNLYWVTEGVYQCAFLTTPDGVVLFDPHVEPPAEIPELHQIAIVHDNLVQEIRDYPSRAAAEAAFEAMR